MYLPWIWHLLNWELNRLLSNKHKPHWKTWILIGLTGQSFFIYFFLFLMTRSQKHQQRKNMLELHKWNMSKLPSLSNPPHLFIWTHSLSFPSSMKEQQLQHLRTTECVFQCNEDLRCSEGLGLRGRPHCRCNFTPEACLIQNENTLSKRHSLFQRYDHTDGNYI